MQNAIILAYFSEKGDSMKSIDFKKLLDEQEDGIACFDENGILLYRNKALLRMLQVNDVASLGESAYDFLAKGLFSSSPVIRAIETKQTVTEYVYHKNGTYVLSTAKPIFSGQGTKVEYVLHILRDVTKRKMVEKELQKSIQQCERYKRQLSETNLMLKSHEQVGLIAESPQMRKLMEVIYRIAPSDATVLLLRESGLGNTAIAEFIHRQSPRAEAPFISINCGALPPSLMESELFGHEKGSFTGAAERKIGLFEAAHGGTLMLDELAELPAELQVKLLSALQERKIRRLGSVREIPIDVRIIAATNRNIAEMVEQKEFRKDLYYRLNTLALDIPPLASRPEDLIRLTGLFLNKYNAMYCSQKKFTPGSFQLLLNYDWPGNIRELDNLVARCVLLAPGDDITPEVLPSQFLRQQNHNHRLPHLEEALEETEKKLLLEAKRRYKTVRAMADALGSSYPTVFRKLKKYGL